MYIQVIFLINLIQNKEKLEEIRIEEVESKNAKIVNLEKELMLRSENYFERENFVNPFSNKKKSNQFNSQSKILNSVMNNDNLINNKSNIGKDLFNSKKKHCQRSFHNEKEETLKEAEFTNVGFVEKAIKQMENFKK